MSSRLSTFSRMLVPHERTIQTSSLFRAMSRSTHVSSVGSTEQQSKEAHLMTAGLFFSGGLVEKFEPSQLILKVISFFVKLLSLCN